MKRLNSVFTIIVVVFATSLSAAAQHAGHGGMGSMGSMGQMDHDMGQMQKMMKLQATEGQRGQFRNCLAGAEHVHQQAQQMASAGGLKAADYPDQRDRLKSAWQEMQQNYDAFIGSLNTDQRTEMKGRIHKIEQLRSTLNSRVAEIDKDLTSPAPDSKRVAGSAKKLQKVIEDWQKQYKGFGEEMGIEG